MNNILNIMKDKRKIKRRINRIIRYYEYSKPHTFKLSEISTFKKDNWTSKYTPEPVIINKNRLFVFFGKNSKIGLSK